jgi:hypothetical protein
VTAGSVYIEMRAFETVRRNTTIMRHTAHAEYGENSLVAFQAELGEIKEHGSFRSTASRGKSDRSESPSHEASLSLPSGSLTCSFSVRRQLWETAGAGRSEMKCAMQAPRALTPGARVSPNAMHKGAQRSRWLRLPLLP